MAERVSVKELRREVLALQVLMPDIVMSAPLRANPQVTDGCNWDVIAQATNASPATSLSAAYDHLEKLRQRMPIVHWE